MPSQLIPIHPTKDEYEYFTRALGRDPRKEFSPEKRKQTQLNIQKITEEAIEKKLSYGKLQALKYLEAERRERARSCSI